MRSGFCTSRSHLRMLTPPYLNGIVFKLMHKLLDVLRAPNEHDDAAQRQILTVRQRHVPANAAAEQQQQGKDATEENA